MGVYDIVDAERCQGTDSFETLSKGPEGSTAEYLVRSADAVHADSHKVHAPHQSGDEGVIEVMRRGGEGYSEPCLLDGVVTEICEMAVEGRLPTSESNTEATIRVEFIKPAGYPFDIQ